MLTFGDLIKACSPGGPSVLTSITELAPAAGLHASVAPAKFVERGSSVFAYETRYVDGESVKAVLIDSKQSQLNRGEQAVQWDIDAGKEPVSLLPHMRVSYGEESFTDLELPHRFADGHFRAATIDGNPATSDARYRAVRDSTSKNITALIHTAPIAALMGGWDSMRPDHQLRLPSALVGEIIGVLADQSGDPKENESKRGGARVDAVGMSVQLESAEMKAVLDMQRDETSPRTVESIETNVKKAKKGQKLSGSALGLGGIPPMLESLGGVACRRIIRSWVLSFAALRQLSFGGSAENDAVGRALIAALGLATIARAERELYVRANCHLVEVEAPTVTMDERYGKSLEMDPITVEEADKLLAEAIEKAREAGVADWHGQVLEFEGNPIIRGAAQEESPEGE